jgi:hypothetical protein
MQRTIEQRIRDSRTGAALSRENEEVKALGFQPWYGDERDHQVFAANKLLMSQRMLEGDEKAWFYYEKFVPDVIIIDYADIIAPTKGFRGEYRHQIDDIWKRLRRMAQERNALVATVSQSDRAGFFEDVTEVHVAEDIRKLAHVTCMLGLSQKKEEKDLGIMRVGQIAIREGKSVTDQAVVLYSYDIGRAVLDSRFKSEVDLKLKDDDEDEEEKDERPTHRRRQRN